MDYQSIWIESTKFSEIMATSALFQMQTDRRPLGSTNLSLIRIWCVFFTILLVLPWNSTASEDLLQKIQISGDPAVVQPRLVRIG